MSSYNLEHLKSLIQYEDQLDDPKIAEVQSEVRTAEIFLFDEAIQQTRLDDV